MEENGTIVNCEVTKEADVKLISPIRWISPITFLDGAEIDSVEKEKFDVNPLKPEDNMNTLIADDQPMEQTITFVERDNHKSNADDKPNEQPVDSVESQDDIIPQHIKQNTHSTGQPIGQSIIASKRCDVFQSPISSTYEPIGVTNGRYTLYEFEDGLYCCDQKTSEMKKVSNFKLRGKCVKHYIYSDCKTVSTIDIKTTVSHQIPASYYSSSYEETGLQVKDCCMNALWVTKLTNGAAWFDNSTEMVNLFRLYFNRVVQLAPSTNTYDRTGWLLYEGRRVFLHGGGAIGARNNNIRGNPDLVINCDERITPLEAALLAFELPKISSIPSHTLPVFIYAHAAILNDLFTEAGFPIRFVMFIEGATNSFKTVRAVEIANLFGRPTIKPHMNFASTRGGIELNAHKYACSVLIVDDLHPANTSRELSIMLEKLDTITRLYGDGVAPHRMNKNYDQSKINTPRGLCLVTGELVDGVASAMSRCLIIKSNGDYIDKQKLTFIQNNSLQISTHYYHFINWVSENYITIVHLIKDKYIQLRMELSHVKGYARFTDTLISMLIVSDILISYGVTIGLVKSEDANDIYDSYRQVMVDVVNQNMESIIDQDPGVMFLRAFYSMLSSGEIELLPTDDVSGKITSKMRGYQDESFFYLQTDKVLINAIAFYSRQQSHLPLTSSKDLTTVLHRIGAIETSEELQNGQPTTRKTLHRKLGTSKPTRYLVIRKEAMMQKLYPI